PAAITRAVRASPSTSAPCWIYRQSASRTARLRPRASGRPTSVGLAVHFASAARVVARADRVAPALHLASAASLLAVGSERARERVHSPFTWRGGPTPIR